MHYVRHSFGSLESTIDSEGNALPVNTASSSQEEVISTANADLVNTAGELAKTSVDNTLSKVSELLSSNEVQETLKSMGLDMVVKNTSREAVKNVLSLLGVWYASSLLKTAIKSKFILLGVGALAVGVYLKGNESLDIMKSLNSKKSL